MKTKLSFLLALTAATASATFAAPAISPADQKMMNDFTSAIKTNNVEAARKLVALPNFSPQMTENLDEGSDATLFEQAIDKQRLAIVRLMMGSAAWKTAKWTPKTTAAALILASADPVMLPILQELSKKPGFDLSMVEANYGDSPLFHAAYTDNLAALKWLATQPKIKLTALNGSGANLLFSAGPKTTVYLLSLHKFDVNARDTDYKSTALHDAVRRNSLAKARALLAVPTINPNLKEEDGESPLDIALSRDFPMSQLLMSSKKIKPTAAQRKLFKEAKINGISVAG